MKELQQHTGQHSNEIETIILGVLLLEGNALETVLPIVRTDDFYNDRHQVIYNAIVTLFTENTLIELISVAQWLNRQKYAGPLRDKFQTQLDYIGGPYYLTQITNAVASSANLQHYCLILKQYSIKRKLAGLTGKYYHFCQQETTDSLELLSKLASETNELLNEIQLQKTTTIGKAVDETIGKMVEASQIEGEAIGIPCGIRPVDKQTLGFSSPDLVILSGTPGEGKSTLALQWAVNMSRNGSPVGFMSLEMKSFQLVLKMISMETGIDIQRLRRGILEDEQWAFVNKAAAFLKHLKFHFSDKGGLSIIDLKGMIYGWVKTQGVKILFLDYIQLVSVFGVDRRFDTREQEVNYISKQLKAICMDLDIPIIALSQMSRKEKGSKRKPVMSDLRESGAIEQDADGIMFVWRPVYNGVTHDNQNRSYQEEDTYLLIEKYRLGRTGAIELTFKGGASMFTQRSPPASVTGVKTNVTQPAEKSPAVNSSRSDGNFDDGFEGKETL